MRRILIEDASQLKHAYIIASEDDEECFSIAMKIASAAVCRGSKDLPCGECSACRKAAGGNHPDIKVIRKGDDPDSKNVISVGQVRDVVLDASVLPNEADRKVYIFRDGKYMNDQAQNAALKLIEEPPEGVIVILCGEKPENFLQTVRSRCIEIVSGATKKEKTESDLLADEYLATVATGNVLKVYEFCENHNDMKIPEAIDFIESCAFALTEMLCSRRDSMGIRRERLLELERLMEKIRVYLNVNVNVKQIFGLLEVWSIARKNKKEV